MVSTNSYPTQAGYQTTSSYDSVRELVSTTSPATAAAPSGATTTFTYDPAENRLTSTDPDSITSTWTYTPTNLKATVSYSGSSAHSVNYTYDANGHRTAMTDATGSSSFIWNPFSELTSATNGANQTVAYSYDADGNTTGITYPLPASATWATTDTVSYGYDHADLLTSAADFNGKQITIGNTADGLPNSAALGSTGDTITSTYDGTDMQSAIMLKNSTATLQSFSYADAPSGDLLTENDTPTSSKTPAVYTYDAKDRVTSMTPGTGSSVSYGFDPSSNLTTLPTGASATYDKAGELTSSTLSGTATSYTYSPNGQRLTAKQGSTTIASDTWNGSGQLPAYSDAAASMSGAIYDGTGLRATMTSTPAGGSSSTQNFVWNIDPAVPQLLMDSANAYIYSTSGTPAEQVNLSNGTATYLVADALGSVRGTVNSAGSLTATTAYDAWGNPSTSSGLTGSTPFGFAGAYSDPTGLIYLIDRYYDPATGQFLSVDPLLSDSHQPYGYASQDPVMFTDPSGQRTYYSPAKCYLRYWAKPHVPTKSYSPEWVKVFEFTACKRPVARLYIIVSLYKTDSNPFSPLYLEESTHHTVYDKDYVAAGPAIKCRNHTQTTHFLGISKATSLENGVLYSAEGSSGTEPLKCGTPGGSFG